MRIMLVEPAEPIGTPAVMKAAAGLDELLLEGDAAGLAHHVGKIVGIGGQVRMDAPHDGEPMRGGRHRRQPDDGQRDARAPPAAPSTRRCAAIAESRTVPATACAAAAIASAPVSCGGVRVAWTMAS